MSRLLHLFHKSEKLNFEELAFTDYFDRAGVTNAA